MKENKKIEIGLIILCLIILIPFIVIAIYNRPSADDYDYAILTHSAVVNNEGIFNVISEAWKTNVQYYNKWQGLYSSAFILALQPGIWGENYYAFTTIIILFIVFVCLYFSFNILNKKYFKYSRFFTVMVSLIVLVIITNWLPSAVEGLYWYNGSMNYTPWIFLDLLNVCLLLNIEKNRKIKNISSIILSIVLSFLISGANHVTSFANILILLLYSIYLLFNKKFYSLPSLFSAIIGFIIMYIAPGTSIRQSFFTKSTMVKTVLATLKHIRIVIPTWCSFIWILSLLIITPIAISFSMKNKIKISSKFIIILFLALAMVLSGMFCVPYYAMGNFGAQRVTNVIWIAFMLFSWLLYIVVWQYIINKKIVNVKFIQNKIINKLYITSGLALILLCIIPIAGEESNSLIAIRELLNDTAYKYSQEIDEIL